MICKVTENPCKRLHSEGLQVTKELYLFSYEVTVKFSSAENKNWNSSQGNREHKYTGLHLIYTNNNHFVWKWSGWCHWAFRNSIWPRNDDDVQNWQNSAPKEIWRDSLFFTSTAWQKLLISNCDLEDKITFKRQMASALLHRCHMSLPPMARPARSEWRRDAAHNQKPGFHYHARLLKA